MAEAVGKMDPKKLGILIAAFFVGLVASRFIGVYLTKAGVKNASAPLKLVPKRAA